MAKHDNWGLVKSCGMTEQKRVRYCRGCVYLGSAGMNACCDYYLVTGNRRPCPAGTKDCSVKKYGNGSEPSAEHIAWCKKVDAEIEARRKELEKAQRVKDLCEQNGVNRTLFAVKRGRRIKWDTDYAFSLYCKGYYIHEIASILDIKVECLQSYMQKHFWRDYRPSSLHFTSHDIEKGRQEYRAYMEKKNSIINDIKQKAEQEVDAEE